MTDMLDCRLLPSDLAVESRVGEETVLLHLESGTYYGLDPLGTRIWEQIKQGVAIMDICTSIVHDFDMPIETVREDVRAFLADLLSQGILVEP